MPLALSRAIDAELARSDVPAVSLAKERRQAEFFAGLATRVIAPRFLRRAGYEALASECETQRDLRTPGGAAAVAQHTIGRECRSPMPRLASIAYGASAHASTCAFYARHGEIETVMQTGNYCARALLSYFDHKDAVAAESTWIWDFTVTAINVAAGINSDNEHRPIGSLSRKRSRLDVARAKRQHVAGVACSIGAARTTACSVTRPPRRRMVPLDGGAN